MNIKAIRQRAGYSQKEFAALLNLPRSTYNQYETGARQADYDTLSRIASFLGASVDDLLGREPPASHATQIPGYGRVAAGIPIEAIEDVIDVEEITPGWYTREEMRALLRAEAFAARTQAYCYAWAYGTERR